LKYIQKIYFGNAGVGKSHKVDNIVKEELEISGSNCIKTVFHPEYSYNDFMVKLSPISKNSKVRYEYNEGDFIKALSQAYKNILESEDSESAKKVALVIDEINRGNSAKIFGKVFQLLDREDNGWSSYAINISNMEFDKLIELIFSENEINQSIGEMKTSETEHLSDTDKRDKAIGKLITNEDIKNLLENKQIKLPPNLSIIATMNTSDESIYFMDSAFKRRWDWEYMDISEEIDNTNKEIGNKKANITDEDDWKDFINKLNNFIKDNAKSIRRVEDKLVGYYFIKYKEDMTNEAIQNKLMFFLWDNVFARDKKPLKELLDDNTLITFGDFTSQVETFVKNIKA